MKIINLQIDQLPPENFTGKAIYYDGDVYYYKNGSAHRTNGPAIIKHDGTKMWFVNGLRHRENGPAKIEFDHKEYWSNNKRHRIGGPANEYINGYKEYWVNGKNVSKEQHDLLVLLYKLKEIKNTI